MCSPVRTQLGYGPDQQGPLQTNVVRTRKAVSLSDADLCEIDELSEW